MISNLHSVDVTTCIDYEEGTGVYLQLIVWKEAKPILNDPEEPAWQRAIIEYLPLSFRKWTVCSMYPREVANNGG